MFGHAALPLSLTEPDQDLGVLTSIGIRRAFHQIEGLRVPPKRLVRGELVERMVTRELGVLRRLGGVGGLHQAPVVRELAHPCAGIRRLRPVRAPRRRRGGHGHRRAGDNPS